MDREEVRMSERAPKSAWGKAAPPVSPLMLEWWSDPGSLCDSASRRQMCRGGRSELLAQWSELLAQWSELLAQWSELGP